MEFERLSGDLRDLRRRNQNLSLALGGLTGCLLVALLSIVLLLGSVRTVVVPPTLNKTFWVAGDKASGEYLEQMGSFIAWLVLDVTPSSIDWKKDMLLGYVEPAQHGALKSRQEVEAERLKRINAATAFSPQQLVASEASQSLVVRGRLRTLVNGHETANELKAYRIDFSHAGARMHIVGFKEVPYAVK
ncbi:type IV conjugative transfer system protein TraE [Pseudorhodoferax soli]|uniref:Conjugal transfer pilus assembly protein TraE n=1 Tax=Pseudorhodoferax soli TaxID=545864 RepID=A0A368XAV8_9BURK|nr:type IV conjugative transfer system protein TraE [Pseudorhodoferax soli]RCW65101.1 conjugal transfer pilus assembly protein TraE [Pseudorhodoferax soli]